jgi:hypothetical protein
MFLLQQSYRERHIGGGEIPSVMPFHALPQGK